MHYILGIFRLLQINHVCDNFCPHGMPKNKFATLSGMSCECEVLGFNSLIFRGRQAPKHKKKVPDGT